MQEGGKSGHQWGHRERWDSVIIFDIVVYLKFSLSHCSRCPDVDQFPLDLQIGITGRDCYVRDV